MNAARPGQELSLLGGPLHRLARHAGLVRHPANTIRVGLVLSLLPWLIGVLLAAAEGVLPELFSIDVIGAHVRLLVAIPLFFVCESVLDPQLGSFTRYCARSGLLTGEGLAAFDAHVARTLRWKDGWVPDAACLAAAVLMAITTPEIPWGGVTSGLDAERAPFLAGWWYWIVCLTLFRFLLFRWIWRFALWCHLLWRLSRLDLRLMPAHADGSGGLGILEEVHTHLLPLVIGLSAVLAASFAEDIATGRTPFDAIFLASAAMLLGAGVLVVGPLTVFAGRSWACRQQGLRDYMALAARYASTFDRKWIGRDAASAEPLLGTADIQTLADLSSGVAIVRNMRVIPIGRRLLIALAVATLLPMLPLLTLKYPVATMLDQIVNRLIGL